MESFHRIKLSRRELSIKSRDCRKPADSSQWAIANRFIVLFVLSPSAARTESAITPSITAFERATCGFPQALGVQTPQVCVNSSTERRSKFSCEGRAKVLRRATQRLHYIMYCVETCFSGEWRLGNPLQSHFLRIKVK